MRKTNVSLYDHKKEDFHMTDKKLPHNHHQSFEHIPEVIPEADDFRTLADIFKQLGDCSRIRIFWLLCHCEECVINISSLVNMSSPAVSHHLRQLKIAGLIVSRRDGKEVYYKAAESDQAQLLHQAIERMMQIACPARKNDDLSGCARQEKIIRAIHDRITGHLDTRYTIEELSRLYLINTASLKKVFKEVYGLPIAAYMKEYRIRKAAELLIQTDESISSVADRVGYETQGKFTSAFKDCIGLTPSSYRKKHRTQSSSQAAGLTVHAH